MSKLSELLNELKENKLNKTYNKVMTDIADIKSALSVVNEEVNDVILGLLSEGKYEEVNKLTSIPALSLSAIEELESLLNGENIIKTSDIEKQIVEVKDTKKDIKAEENLKYSGIITSIKGLKKGAQVVHKSFGIGKIVSLEDNPTGENKILKVNFDSCGEKPFSCSAEILEKYFDISINEEESKRKRIYNYDINDELKELFSSVENIIFGENAEIVKEKTNVYYKYSLGKKIICTINCTPKRFAIYFNAPYGNLIDANNLLEDVSNKGHLGIGDYKLVVKDNSNFEEIKDFVRQTLKYYENN